MTLRSLGPPDSTDSMVGTPLAVVFDLTDFRYLSSLVSAVQQFFSFT